MRAEGHIWYISQLDMLFKNNRLYYLDWLRVITIIAVFLHHCSRVFDIRNTHTITSLLPMIHREIGNLWMMPLFFIISGAAVCFSFNKRNIGGFIKERLIRILLPLLTIGTFVIAPLFVYFDRIINGKFTGDLFQWYPYFFKNEYPNGNSGHLWFLFFLFIYTLLLLLFFIPVGKKRVSLFSRFSGLFKKSWRIFLLFLPLIIIAPLEIYSTRIAGGWGFLPYLLFFICGYLFYSNDYIRESVDKYYIFNITSAFILTIVYIYLEFSSTLSGVNAYMIQEYGALSGLVNRQTDLSSALLGFFILRHITVCFWMLAMLGFAKRFLNFNNKFLSYANEAVMPFYLLHMTVIYAIDYFIVDGSSSIAAKYIIITVSSFVITIAIYEFVIRRFILFRLLFGMKLIKSANS